jgi:parallel beta-helix repeat protein
MLLSVVAVACLLASAALPLSHATSNCPTSGVPITANLILNSDCTYTSQEGIVLGANGITLDCAGHSIKFSGSGSYTGISNQEGTAIKGDTVKDCKLSGGWNQGMVLQFMTGLTLTANTITGPGLGSLSRGFNLENVGPATITGNTVASYMYGFYMYDVGSVTLSGNTATGTSSGDDGFYVEYGYGLTISGNTATGFTTGYGFYIDDSGPIEYGGPGGSLASNTASHNEYGFYMDWSSGFALVLNKADSNSQYGFDDYSYGSGPFGLGNTYSSNECSSNGVGSYDEEAGYGPAWLCTPQG